LKPESNVNLISIIEIGIDAIKNFIEGPNRMDQEDLSRSRVLHSLEKIIFTGEIKEDNPHCLNLFPLTY
jgi:hypothetical protein